jgi:tetratricopeptide (TPR) repeat protein
MASTDKIVKRADEAFAKNNLDYAIELYQQTLVIDPNDVTVRKKLRTTERKRAVGKEGGSLLTKGFGAVKGLGSGLKRTISSKLQKNPAQAMIECEKDLVDDPNNVGLLVQLGEAAQEAGHREAAIYVLEDTLQLQPDDPKIFRMLGRLHYSTDEAKASSYFERLLQIDSADKEAHEAVRDLAARATMKAGVERAALETGDYHDMMKDKKSADKLEQDQRILKTDEERLVAIQSAEAALKDKPNDTRLWIKLGDIRGQLRQFEEARKAYQQVLEIDPAHVAVKFKLGDLKLAEFDHQIKITQEALQKAPDHEEHRQSMARLQAERTAFAVEDFAARVKAHPTDLPLRYRYGDSLMKAGRTEQAIAEFQQAVNDPKYRRRALLQLANCFMRHKEYELAASRLQKALEELSTMNEEAKQIHYTLGQIYEKQNRSKEAEEHLRKIYEVDITYRDVAARLKKLKGDQTQEVT